jgi:hypothetical protein
MQPMHRAPVGRAIVCTARKRLLVEWHLPALVEMCRTIDSALMDPYIEKLYDTMCKDCEYKDKPACPFPLDYLLQLAVEAVEKVEHQRARGAAIGSS